MKIEKIINQSRRDFTTIYKCEHCGYTYEGSGYDDTFFHESVIPKKECKKCGKTADESYRPLATRYPDDQVI
jgi:ribosomal protein L37AE/L43A